MDFPYVDKVGGTEFFVRRIKVREWPAYIFCSAKHTLFLSSAISFPGHISWIYIASRRIACCLMSYGRTSGGGNRYSGGGSFGPKPVETGKEYNIQITETSRQGDGVAKVQGFVIFVKNAKMGQNVKVKITNVGARFATAELAAPQDTQPPQ